MFLFGMYFLGGFPTVISLSRLIISWISDASMDFLCFAFGFSSVGFVLPGGGDPWPSVTAVVFALCFWSITAFCEAGSSPMPSVWLSAGVVTFAVG